MKIRKSTLPLTLILMMTACSSLPRTERPVGNFCDEARPIYLQPREAMCLLPPTKSEMKKLNAKYEAHCGEEDLD